MSDRSLDILDAIEPEGWRVWSLHQHTRGFWEARLYNVTVRDRGEGSGYLSPHGQGTTPRDAILAALGRQSERDELAALPQAVVRRLEDALDRLAETLR